MWVNQLTHTVTHTRKGLKSAGREVCASRPAFLYEENHSLGEWFKRSLMAMMQTEKVPLL